MHQLHVTLNFVKLMKHSDLCHEQNYHILSFKLLHLCLNNVTRNVIKKLLSLIIVKVTTLPIYKMETFGTASLDYTN